MPRKRPIEHPRGRVSFDCRSSDSARVFQRDEFERCRPIQRGTSLFFTVPWHGHWFDPLFHLGQQFPYVGSFEGELARFWFACDGSEVASFIPWADSLSAMQAAPPQTPAGEIDLGRLEAFQKYVKVRQNAYRAIETK